MHVPLWKFCVHEEMTNALILKGSYCDNLPPEYWWWEHVPEVVSAMSLDPQRVYPDREYPRWSANIPDINHGRQKQAQVYWELRRITAMHIRLEVWLMPSPHIKDKLPQPIGSIDIDDLVMLTDSGAVSQFVVQIVERFLQKLQ